MRRGKETSRAPSRECAFSAASKKLSRTCSEGFDALRPQRSSSLRLHHPRRAPAIVTSRPEHWRASPFQGGSWSKSVSAQPRSEADHGILADNLWAEPKHFSKTSLLRSCMAETEQKHQLKDCDNATSRGTHFFHYPTMFLGAHLYVTSGCLSTHVRHRTNDRARHPLDRQVTSADT